MAGKKGPEEGQDFQRREGPDHYSYLLLCDEPLQNVMAEDGKDLLFLTILVVVVGWVVLLCLA